MPKTTKIRVLGSGCPTCQKLDQLVQSLLPQLGFESVDYKYLIGTEGTQAIIQLGLMHSPVLTVNDRVAMVGFINDKAKIKDKILSLAKIN